MKQHADGTLERLKARLVIRRDIQREEIDFNETFSPIVKMTIIRCLLSITAKQDWEVSQFDVSNAFLQGDLPKEVYMKFSAGLTAPNPNLLCKLRKLLYGLKQASRQWYSKLVGALSFKGFTTSLNDYSLFFQKLGGLVSIIAVYVNDILITGDDHKEIQALKVFLHQGFKIKDLGFLHYFIGMKILRDQIGIIISQQKYSLDLLQEFDVSHVPCASSPTDPSHRLSADSDEYILDPTLYRHLIGKLNYLTHTRLDLCFDI